MELQMHLNLLFGIWLLSDYAEIKKTMRKVHFSSEETTHFCVENCNSVFYQKNKIIIIKMYEKQNPI